VRLRARRRHAGEPAGGDGSVIGEEHAWWAEREGLQRVFVVSSEHEATAGDDRSLDDFWSPDSLFTYDQRDTDDPLEDATAEIVDPYAVLGLPITASWAEVTVAHRKLAKRYHPDLLLRASVEERAAAEEQMRLVNRAYSQLQRTRKGDVS
jgi:hypothetical protein